MAKPRIFISSTYYDLKHIRSSLENFIDSMGYEPFLSEKGSIAYSPDRPLDESCYREVVNCDILLLIIGGRYGSEVSKTRKCSDKKEFYERYDSVTKREFQTAISKDIPVYILIDKYVYADYETYLQNIGNNSVKYAHVDSVNIFKLIEDILLMLKNNPILHFDKYFEIECWLKEQWAGLFRELLSRSSDQKQLSSLSAQIDQLSDVNKTLQVYLEQLVSKAMPAESSSIINKEQQKLEESRIAFLSENRLIKFLHARTNASADKIIRSLSKAKTMAEFCELVSAGLPEETTTKLVMERFFMTLDDSFNELNKLREKLEQPHFERIASDHYNKLAKRLETVTPVASNRKKTQGPQEVSQPKRAVKKKKT